MSLVILDAQSTNFPHPSTAQTEPNGLLAMGGDLSPDRLVSAYKQGIFPWYDTTTPILWWSPNPRAILRIDDLIISHSLRKLASKQNFSYQADTQFENVIDACAERTSTNPDLPSTWITPELKQAYIKLHQMGIAHSIEIMQDQALVGGLYGVCLGRNFFGESMFHRKNNFSKIALLVLAAQLKRWGFSYIDCQVWSKHLGSLGAIEIERDTFLKLIQANLAQSTLSGSWHLDKDLLPYR